MSFHGSTTASSTSVPVPLVALQGTPSLQFCAQLTILYDGTHNVFIGYGSGLTQAAYGYKIGAANGLTSAVIGGFGGDANLNSVDLSTVYVITDSANEVVHWMADQV